MEKRFTKEPNIGIRSRIVQCRILQVQGKHKDAGELLTGIRSELDDIQEIDANIGLDYAKTLFRLEHTDDAKKFLAALAEQFSNNLEILQKIENLLDEPVGFRQKLQARSLNREGIKAFESGDLESATKAFSKALNIVPGHAALNLNLVQVLMKEYQLNPERKELSERCQKYLNRLYDLPEQHRQYQRYQALKRKLEEMVS
jgi:tetratricopeptide (TPR) repeat protein